MEVCTTAAHIPFQNRLCERIHAGAGSLLVKLVNQFPKTSLNMLQTWENMARNSLQKWHGYSSYQLDFGKNPNLPNIMTDNLPALVGTTSEILAKHVQTLHESRKTFI